MPAPFGVRGSWLVIDLSAIRHNLRRVRDIVGPTTRIFAVVKANGYGHGAVPVARAALQAGADAVAVATVAEAEELRGAGLDARILILGGIPVEAASAAVGLDCEVVVGGMRLLEAISDAGLAARRRAPVHLKFDTGMTRVGLDARKATEAVAAASRLKGISVRGICSHLATAEAADDRFARLQMRRMRRICRVVEGLSPPIPVERHVANSAAVLRWPRSHLDAVRVGLLTYGISPGGVCTNEGFRPALSWQARPLYVRQARKGDTVGYGRRHRLTRKSLLMVVPVGYADGYPRTLTNKASVLVRGHRAPVVGAVSMDSLVADVTDVPEVGLYDEVVVLGSQGDDEITVAELAELAETVPHEIVARIAARVPRAYVNETGDQA